MVVSPVVPAVGISVRLACSVRFVSAVRLLMLPLRSRLRRALPALRRRRDMRLLRRMLHLGMRKIFPVNGNDGRRRMGMNRRARSMRDFMRSLGNMGGFMPSRRRSRVLRRSCPVFIRPLRHGLRSAHHVRSIVLLHLRPV